MTIEWNDIMESLKKWVRDATGLITVGREEERPFGKSRYDDAIALLHVITTNSVGVDDVRTTDNLDAAPLPNLDVALYGQRGFTLSLQIESHSQKPGKTAHSYIENARTSLRLPSVLDSLHMVGLAHIESTPTVTLDHVVDGHMISRANMDIRFGVAESMTDTPQYSIESAIITSTFRAPDGTSIPSPPNVTSKEIP